MSRRTRLLDIDFQIDVENKVPAQPVDATLFYSVDPIVFFKETRSFVLYSIKPKQGSVFFESALSNEFSH